MKRFLLSLFVLVAMYCSAQQQGQALMDSLLSELPKANDKQAQLKLYNLLAYYGKGIDPNAGIGYGLKQLELSQELKSPKAIASAYNVLGLCYQEKSDLPKALECYNKAIAIYADDQHSLGYGSIISNIAVVYKDLGKFDKALSYNFISLGIDSALHDIHSMASDYGNIGVDYYHLGDFEKALSYDMRSLAIFQRTNDKDAVAENYGNIGNVYKKLRKYQLAIDYYTKALTQFEALGSNSGMAINLGNLGWLYLEAATDAMQPRGTATSLGAKAELLQRSVGYFTKCLQLAEMNGLSNDVVESSRGIYLAQSWAGNYAAALESYKQYITYKDSVYSHSNKLKVAMLETEREVMLKNKQIQIEKLQLAQKRNEWIILVITIVLLVVVMALGVRQFMKQKKRNAELSEEKTRHLDRIEKQKIAMGDIARVHSHEVGGQVSTILGLVEVFNLKDHSDPDNKVVLEGIAETAGKLDIIVKEMIIKENKLNDDAKTK